MHLSDALLSPAVAITTGLVSIGLIAISIRKVSKQPSDSAALMGVMGAFVFAAQMINFAIPGTGSSGHIIGGVLLATILGPWAAFLTLTSVLILQALLFADGGLMALGCNILNMAAIICLAFWPLVYRPLAGKSLNAGRIMWVSILTCSLGLAMAAAAVTVETELSGITALPTLQFLGLMVPIHLVIGVVEGVATGVILAVVARWRADLFYCIRQTAEPMKSRDRTVAIVGFALVAIVLSGLFTLLAGSSPDGLEWSIERLTQGKEIANQSTPLHSLAQAAQQKSALVADYGTSAAGLIGAGVILLITFLITWAIRLAGRK